MPKITVSKKLFYSLIGEKISTNELEQKMVCAKAELDGEDEKTLKIELNDTNRPDLWTTAGLARQLKQYYHTQKTSSNKYSFFNLEATHTKEQNKDKYIQVDDSVKDKRPYVLGFIVSGVKVTTEILEELIQIQEKLCDNFGQKRKVLAIGIYREDLMTWPVSYMAENAKTTMFTALDCEAPQTLYDILQTHPKGKEFAHLLDGFDEYPILRDSEKEVLSMPPVINSAFLGAVKEGDNRLFIECTGDNLQTLLLASNIFACDCFDLGFTVERVESRYSYKTPMGKEVVSLQQFQKPVTTTVEDVQKLLGEDISQKDIIKVLQKMDVEAQIDEKGIHVIPPAYRNDFLHGVDIIEDVMIGYGIENLIPQMPKNFTVGRLQAIEELSRRTIDTMVGLGFQEMLFPYLGGIQQFITNMYSSTKIKDNKTEEQDENVLNEEQKKALENIIRVANPLSENYEIVRPSAIPNLLESERVSANYPYPHKICEVGKVVVKDKTENYGSKTNTMLSFLIASANASFTEINSIVAAVLYYEDISWHAELAEDVRFIDKRLAKIIKDDDNLCLGVFGEINPQVLQNFDITMPCVAGEICLDLLLKS